MAEPVAMEESQYIKKTDLDALMGKIVSSLQPRIESIVEQAVQKAIEQATAKTDEKIAVVTGQIKGEIRGEVNARLDQHIEQERQQRQQDIEAVRGQIKNFGDETRNKLGEFNMVVSEAKQTVESLNQQIRGWSNSLDANQKLYEQNRRDIEKHNNDLDTIKLDIAVIEEHDVKTVEQLKAINYAIYGGNGDGPKSLYALIETMNLEMNRRFTAQEAISETTLELARTTSNRQDKQEQDAAERKQRWEKRRGMAKETIKEVTKTPYFWIISALLLLVVAGIFRPEILPLLIEFVQKLFATK